VLSDSAASGILATMGGRFGGWALYMDVGKPAFSYAYSNQPEHKYRVVSDQATAPGQHVVRCVFNYDGGGIGKGATGTLFVDGKQVAEGRIEQSIRARISLDETLDIGMDTGTPVIDDYVDKMPFAFTGTLKKFVVILEPDKLTPEERKALREQEAKASMTAH
jgi:arylsulfatase